MVIVVYINVFLKKKFLPLYFYHFPFSKKKYLK